MSVMRELINVLWRPANKTPVPYAARSAKYSQQWAGRTGVGPHEDELRAMTRNGTLFAIIDALSTGVSSVEWELYRKFLDGKHQNDDEREVVTKHAALDLWNKPNPFMTGAFLRELCQMHFDLTGECAIILSKAGSIPIEMWPVRPDKLVPVPDPDKFLAGWVYIGPEGQRIPFKVDEVLHMRKPSVLDPYRGQGAVGTISVDLDAADYAAQWNRNFFLNSAEPGGIVQVDRRLSDDEFDELQTRWNEQHRGVQRAHRVAILEAGTYIPRSLSQRDMQFSELRNASRDVLMEAFRVSKTSLGITDDVNRASALASEYQFSSKLTVPRLTRWREMANVQLLPMFGSTGKNVEFDYKSPVQSDVESDALDRTSKVQAAVAIMGIPGVKFDVNDVFKAYDLPEIDHEEVEPPPALAPFAGADPADPGATLDGGQPDGSPAPGPAGTPPLAPGKEPAPEPPAAHVSRETAHLHAAADPGAPLGVDLTELATAWDKALASIMGQWEGVRAAWRTDLSKQVTKIAKRGKFAELAQLQVDPTAGAAALRLVLADTGDRAYAGVVRDGMAQGVDIPARASAAAAVRAAAADPEQPVPPDDVASTIAALLAAQMAVSAAAEAIRLATPGIDPVLLAELVTAFLVERSTASESTAFGGAITGAQNRGRRDAYAAGPVGSLYAVEKLDGNTCPPCAAINGRFICTTDDMAPYDRLYTSVGGYVDCDGRLRCRGVVTGVWRPQSTGGAT